MKNIPRIFIQDNIKPGMIIPAPSDVAHYIGRVMRRTEFLVFNNGYEYNANLIDNNRNIIIGAQTAHDDPSMDITLMFAPIKRTDDLINMATQLGVARFLPVITQHTNAGHINWDRMRKIAIESAEQSNRNSVPEILPPVAFDALDLRGIAFADERAAYGARRENKCNATSILVGPEGGFTDSEFAALDAAGACGIGLGRTILRAELAAAIAVSKLIKS